MKNKKYFKKTTVGIGKLIMPVILCFVFLTNVSAQETKYVTINKNDISVKELFREIEKQSGYTFFYNNADLNVEQRISVNATNKSIQAVLKDALPANIVPQISNKQIVLVKQQPGTTPAAQPKSYRLSGKVTDSNGAALPGTTVVLDGTTNGTTTGPDGMYILDNVSPSAILKISFIGYVTQTIAIDGKIRIDVVLKEETKAVDEVVVVGYGTQKKSDVTGAISSIKSGDLQNRSVSNAASALQGKSAGVQVVNTTGAPGASSTLRIRGYASNGSSDPLYIVDGLKVSNINYLDPDNIESIEVLKDGASAAIYGAEAGNGILLITTKTGKKGEGKIFYNGSYSVVNLAKKLDILNAADYVTYLKEIGVPEDDLSRYYYNNPSFYVNNKPADTDWQNVMFETGMRQRHTLGFQGGNDRGSFYMSLNYMNNDGIVVSSEDSYKRFSFQLNGSYRIKDWLEVGTTNSIDKTSLRSVPENDFHNAAVTRTFVADPLTPLEFEDGLTGASALVQQAVREHHSPFFDPKTGNYYGATYWGIANNPLPSLSMNKNHTESYGINGTLYGNLTPIKGLTYTSRLGYRINNSYNSRYTAPYWYPSEFSDSPHLNNTQTGSFYYQWENFINYVFSIKKSSFSAIAGMSFINSVSNYVGADTYGLQSLQDNFLYLDYTTPDATDNVRGNTTDRKQIAYYGRLAWNFDNKYNLNFNFRADAYDAAYLSLTNPWGYFPSVSGGWTISNEPFMKGINHNAFSFLKVRASWGINGSISNLGNYMYSTSLTSGGSYYYMDGQMIPTVIPSTTLANPKLRWEESKQTDIGLDMRFLKDRLSFTADYYNKNTDGMLIRSTATLTTGASTVYQNLGLINNHGFEFDLEWRDKVGKDFIYTVKANLATVSNKVTKYRGKGIRLESKDVMTGSQNVAAFEEGYPVWYLRGYQLKEIDPATGNPVFVDQLTVDSNGDGVPDAGDGVITTSDKTYIGDGIPDFTYGATISLAYKNFDFLIYGAGSQGSQIMYGLLYPNLTGINFNNRPHFVFDDRWTPDHTNATKPSSVGENNPYYAYSDAVVFDDSFFKIKQIQLGYNFPARWLKKISMSSFRAYVSLEDFFTFSKYPGLDPEIRQNTTYSMALDEGGYPVPRIVMFGVNVTF